MLVWVAPIFLIDTVLRPPMPPQSLTLTPENLSMASYNPMVPVTSAIADESEFTGHTAVAAVSTSAETVATFNVSPSQTTQHNAINNP